jgi:hypothetical protein
MRPAPQIFSRYELDSAYDEMFDLANKARPQYKPLHDRLTGMPEDVWKTRQEQADLMFLNQGITFTVYSSNEGTEKIFPYDLLPRIITASEWATLEKGLEQRIIALNMFLADIYHEGKILKDKVVPRDMVESCPHYRPEMKGIKVPNGVYVSVTGPDLIRMPDGKFAVLEDNLRVPSGVSYMLTNRQVMKHVFPALVQLLRRAAHRPLRTGIVGGPQEPHSRRRDRSHRGLADPGRVQLGLLRAHLPGPPDGRGPWSRVAIWWSTTSACTAHHQRAAARGRHLPAHRRRLPRPQGVPGRFHRSGFPG